MALKEYRIGDRTYLFDEDKVPADAELVDRTKAADQPANKAAKRPANKAGKPSTK